MANKYSIPIILGTSRKDAQSLNAANLIKTVASDNSEIAASLIDPTNFKLPYDGNEEYAKDPKYTKITNKADAFVLVVPEYNHSFPGSLKRLLDSELKNYNKKPVSLVGVSAGPWGGTRAIQSIIPVLRELGLIVSSYDLHFPVIQNIFDKKGNLVEKEYKDRAKKFLDELLWLSKGLKKMREGNL